MKPRFTYNNTRDRNRLVRDRNSCKCSSSPQQQQYYQYRSVSPPSRTVPCRVCTCKTNNQNKYRSYDYATADDSTACSCDDGVLTDFDDVSDDGSCESYDRDSRNSVASGSESGSRSRMEDLRKNTETSKAPSVSLRNKYPTKENVEALQENAELHKYKEMSKTPSVSLKNKYSTVENVAALEQNALNQKRTKVSCQEIRCEGNLRSENVDCYGNKLVSALRQSKGTREEALQVSEPRQQSSQTQLMSKQVLEAENQIGRKQTENNNYTFNFTMQPLNSGNTQSSDQSPDNSRSREERIGFTAHFFINTQPQSDGKPFSAQLTVSSSDKDSKPPFLDISPQATTDSNAEPSQQRSLPRSKSPETPSELIKSRPPQKPPRYDAAYEDNVSSASTIKTVYRSPPDKQDQLSEALPADLPKSKRSETSTNLDQRKYSYPQVDTREDTETLVHTDRSGSAKPVPRERSHSSTIAKDQIIITSTPRAKGDLPHQLSDYVSSFVSGKKSQSGHTSTGADDSIRGKLDDTSHQPSKISAEAPSFASDTTNQSAVTARIDSILESPDDVASPSPEQFTRSRTQSGIHQPSAVTDLADQTSKPPEIPTQPSKKRNSSIHFSGLTQTLPLVDPSTTSESEQVGNETRVQEDLSVKSLPKSDRGLAQSTKYAESIDASVRSKSLNDTQTHQIPSRILDTIDHGGRDKISEITGVTNQSVKSKPNGGSAELVPRAMSGLSQTTKNAELADASVISKPRNGAQTSQVSSRIPAAIDYGGQDELTEITGITNQSVTNKPNAGSVELTPRGMSGSAQITKNGEMADASVRSKSRNGTQTLSGTWDTIDYGTRDKVSEITGVTDKSVKSEPNAGSAELIPHEMSELVQTIKDAEPSDASVGSKPRNGIQTNQIPSGPSDTTDYGGRDVISEINGVTNQSVKTEPNTVSAELIPLEMNASKQGSDTYTRMELDAIPPPEQYKTPTKDESVPLAIQLEDIRPPEEFSSPITSGKSPSLMHTITSAIEEAVASASAGREVTVDNNKLDTLIDLYEKDTSLKNADDDKLSVQDETPLPPYPGSPATSTPTGGLQSNPRLRNQKQREAQREKNTGRRQHARFAEEKDGPIGKSGGGNIVMMQQSKDAMHFNYVLETPIVQLYGAPAPSTARTSLNVNTNVERVDSACTDLNQSPRNYSPTAFRLPELSRMQQTAYALPKTRARKPSEFPQNKSTVFSHLLSGQVSPRSTVKPNQK